MGLPDPSLAGPSDLAPAVLAALDEPRPSTDRVIDADGIPFFVRSWGDDPTAPPLLLVHGITASSRIWWRVGPALGVALGRRVIAPDQAGHGRTGHWRGRVALRENGRSILALVRALDVDESELAVIGHSWGAMTVAWLPSLGLWPAVTVLLDPPAVSLEALSAMIDDPVERRYHHLSEAMAAVGRLHPTWSYGDVEAKADALTQLDEAAVRAVLTENGDWDAGLAALVAAGTASAEGGRPRAHVTLVRGEPAHGGLVPDAAARALAEEIGRDNVVTIARGGHSPMRQLPEATVAVLAAALGAPQPRRIPTARL